MVTIDRPVAVVTLFLLQVFAVGASAGVLKITPERDLSPQPAAVAERRVMDPGKTEQVTGAGKIPGAALASRLSALNTEGKISGVVLDSETGKTLFDAGSAKAAVPASTTKIVTSTAALAALGPSATLTTTAVRKGGRLVLVGGGDPTLSSKEKTAVYPQPASVVDLARETAETLKAEGVTRITVDYDSSLYEGSAMGPGWKPTYVTEGSVAPINALMVDNGRSTPNPCEGTVTPSENGPKAATQAFARQLGRFGVTASVGRPASGQGGKEVASVDSPPVAELVEHLMQCSDNEVAEAMARQVALKKKLPASFEGGAQAVRAVLQSLGMGEGVAVVDGSGLSPLNRITPLALARIVSLAASGEHPELSTVLTGMPVSGFSGTLSERFLGLPSAGLVRAKTGTLNGVATLAGIAYDSTGRLMSFAFMANDAADLTAARTALDTLADTVVTCAC
ncbi:D-alanyl-D-alanine carboxypeptidase/D-alanyl-D-alanine-endopeptidase (penicillin-binding protein 4) [Actinocorallia herbida]|uniref:D-alanyl-D-alanine carboxypeptidase/D-alanyl-D-alanine-endopeptidase (Penicillin-binding protein 4) n=1 Tax=Actinocorallia herbida TaxID=58109 RepID=A0A3N1DA54_9ACTN|nr:D-alanyl-D-alanine carboxypeptidase/D-alanyl-D-alanine-endopeptidase [Actinocorallia herbida]ROO90384.1 D-alanyl-D-alanine carboxypeptidase/D-alanyl-D-alanine-endopeptidase (penicillin-binding protein 4) [Actinocorallia herbida]